MAAIGFSPAILGCNFNKQKPNIIFLLTDQWRASATGYAGDPNVKTPNLDHLAKESINFRNAVSVCPVCTPYRASLMTGRYPTSTGMFHNDVNLPDSELCIAEVLQDEGYKTGYIGKWHLDGHGRYEFVPPERRQGYEYWKGAECDHEYNQSHYYAGNSDKRFFWDGYDVYAQTNDARQFIKEHAAGDSPFALFVSYGTPHFPHHTAPENYKNNYPPEKIELPPNVPEEMKSLAQKEAQGYYGHCEATDKSIGELLAEIDKSGIRNNSILVFTSDHGEMMGSHGVRPGQKQVPWNESAGVPFLLRFPVIHGDKGQTVNMPLTTPDITATITGLAGIKIPTTFEGNDFSATIRGNKEIEEHASLYMGVAPFARVSNELNKEYRAIRTERYTFVRSIDGPWMLYDNLEDPHQLRNLAGVADYAKLQEKLEQKLQMLLAEIGDDFRPAESYIKEWGLEVDSRGYIPFEYFNQKPQTPKRI